MDYVLALSQVEALAEQGYTAPEDQVTISNAVATGISFDKLLAWLIRYGPKSLSLLREIQDAWPNITLEKVMDWGKRYGPDLVAFAYEIMEALGGYSKINSTKV